MTEANVDAGQAPADDNAPLPGGVPVSEGESTAPAKNGNGSEATGDDGKTLAAGNDATKEPSQEEDAPYWKENWRQKIAEHYGAGNKKTIEKELRRLEGISDPAALYAHLRGMENTWATKNFVKLPGKDAKPEDIAEFNKALGVPEKPEDYMGDLKFDDGLVLGDEDKPLVEDFAKVAHDAGLTPQQMQKAVGWYLQQQQEQGYALDEADEGFQAESRKALQEEYGTAYRRLVNNVSSAFQKAPGGTDINNPDSVYARLLGGRTADGRIIGNDPDVVHWLVSVAQEINPAASVVEDGDLSGQSVDDKIATYERRMAGKDENDKHDPAIRRAYFKDETAQAEYRRLVAAREKIRAKA